jgi:hypothetical protein
MFSHLGHQLKHSKNYYPAHGTLPLLLLLLLPLPLPLPLPLLLPLPLPLRLWIIFSAK